MDEEKKQIFEQSIILNESDTNANISKQMCNKRFICVDHRAASFTLAEF